MDKETRNRIQRATQAARTLLEREYAEQLEGVFDIRLDGTIVSKPGAHLDAVQRVLRTKLVSVVEHDRASGMTNADAVAACLREAAFTTLNRFVALKMLEARELVQECVGRGDQSAGFMEFAGLAPGLVQLDDRGYRIYIESIFDEIGREVRVLFDRNSPNSVLWPRRQTLAELLEILNAADLSGVWSEDETIGWVYQYFNGDDERRKMREESQAPRNSRELAVRNQFFTPRYVVQFLTDNTLGRIWYEMRGTKTVLAEKCEYMVRKPGEEFAPRAKKDPRDLRVLDPACGSGHFLLYAFDLLLAIYEEAHLDPESPRSEVTGKTLSEDYPSPDALRKAIPVLVLAHNLHGVDIDPRCTQIAQLALWMRAQKACRDFGIGRGERAQIRRSNIVVAEPLVADEQIAREFVAKLGDAELGRVFTALAELLSIAGVMGLLLPIETMVTGPTKRGETRHLFAPPEEQILEAIKRFAMDGSQRPNPRRRLFVDDTFEGFELLRVAMKRFDTVLMNPPFGEFIPTLFHELAKLYPDSKRDIGIAFIERGIALLANGGQLGALVSRKPFFVDTQNEWRAKFPGARSFVAFADLGHKVLDNALVEVAAVVIRAVDGDSSFIDCLTAADKQAALRSAIDGQHPQATISRNLAEFAALPSLQFAYYVDPGLLAIFRRSRPYEPYMGVVRMGLTTSDNDRFVRIWWEVSQDQCNQRWVPIVKGGEYAPYFSGFDLVVKWESGQGEMAAYNLSVGNEAQSRRGVRNYFLPALTYTERTASRFAARVLPAGAIFTGAGPAILPKDAHTLLCQLAIFSSWCFAALYEVCLGVGDAVSSGAAARHYTSGLLGRMPFPQDLAPLESRKDVIEDIFRRFLAMKSLDGASPYAAGAAGDDSENPDEWGSLDEAAQVRTRYLATHSARIVELSGKLEGAVAEAYGFNLDDARAGINAVVGPHPDWLPRFDPSDNDWQLLVARVRALYAIPMDELVDLAAEELGNARYLALKAYCADRRLELVSHILGVHPCDIVLAVSEGGAVAAEDPARVANGLVERVMESLWSSPGSKATALNLGWSDIAFEPGHMTQAVRMRRATADRIYSDDSGHTADVVVAFKARLESMTSIRFASSLGMWMGDQSDPWRSYIARSFFVAHLASSSMHRRNAPRLWQLATRSASYSVWLHIHAFSKDTLFRVQNDYVAPKLAHEERRLESLTNELRDGATAAQRKELAAQEAFVEELRAFLDEVKRVAPLWKPNLDDGVIINFAPLWRLVPQNKSWQKELKSTWDALCEGKYDWAHLALHLWPERVVPKCAKDRSLAIAHGLEDVFWVEGSNGKWTARKTPTRSVDELVSERTSPAVKAALASLLDAPSPAASRARGRSSPRVGGTLGRSAIPRTEAAAGGAASRGRASTPMDSDVLRTVREAIAARGDGASRADVMEAAGITGSEWDGAIKALLADGSVKQTGERRGARYHIVGGND